MPGQVDWTLLIAFVLALGVSAFFSSSETAFMSLQRVRLRHLEETGVRGARSVRNLMEHVDRTLVTILIGNNLVNTAAAAMGTVMVTALLGPEAGVLVATLGVTVLLLVFGEITPKTIAIRHTERLALLYAAPMKLLTVLFSPFSRLLTWTSTALASATGGSPRATGLSPAEIRTVILMGEEAGVLHAELTGILRNAIDLQTMNARQIMVPRTEVVGVEASESLEGVVGQIARTGFTRYPVYEGDLDHIVGIVHGKDLLLCLMEGAGGVDLRAVMRPPSFTPATKSLSSLLAEMREQRTQMVVVVDEYGGTAGIVTLEDLIEEVVGEITSEYGVERRQLLRVEGDEAVVEGGVNIADLNQAFDTRLEVEDVDTVGGLLLKQGGRIPRVGEVITYEGLEFTVLTMRRRRIGNVRVRKVDKRAE